MHFYAVGIAHSCIRVPGYGVVLYCMLTMSNTEQVSKETPEGEQATGGLTLTASAEDTAFDELHQRMKQLNAQDRRRTLSRLSRMFELEEVVPKQAPGGIDSSLRGDQNFDNVSFPAQRQVTSVVVHQSDKRTLPRFSGAEKLGQGEVTFRRWQRTATQLV